ncbi:hypothetical protein NBRC10513v2_003674 [Rhodotorula toruloides]|uniref:Dynactin subunit 4 n=2 Tax=Rhodotorula toruloides TaxID=5286 RepID=A0A2T0ADF8_RHOTO|nr:Dynactin p62 family-domain containing protein [Rhodotorula toruloides]
MSAHEALIHCSCTAPFSVSRPPPSDPPLSLFQHHSLSDLLFCEDCDAVRCNSCAACEVACYYCPNCLFEVPSASVRGEKNRCARNCFQCPQCDHTLSVVASDPDPSLPLNTAAASVGEPPYFLTCTFCRWDSKEVGIEFEKPTGLALQLQKAEEPTADLLEFDHIKDHLEPYLRRSQAQSTSSTHAHAAGASSSSAVLSAASAQLFKDVPGLGTRYGGSGSFFGTSSRARGGGGDAGQAADELERYSSLYPSRGGEPGSEKENRRARAASKGKAVDRDAEVVARMREMTDFEEVASLDRRWTAGWQPPVFSSELRPLRTPLQAKLSKRCPVCMHILIKPEQKSSSTRYKIKLVAANYLPSISIQRRLPASIGSRLSAIAAGTASGLRRTARTGAGRDDGSGTGDEEPLRPGRTYTFELSFTNPLYEPIHVRLAVARPGANKPVEEGQQPPPPPFAVNLPSPTFPIAAYAEDWEYEDQEDEEDAGGEEGDGRASPTKRKGKGGPGIVERKMNRTTIAMDVAIAKDAVGPLRANMLVTYVYQADDAVPPSPTKSPQKGGSKAQDVKTFSFWTLVPLGTVVPRPMTEPRRSMAVSSGSAA